MPCYPRVFYLDRRFFWEGFLFFDFCPTVDFVPFGLVHVLLKVVGVGVNRRGLPLHSAVIPTRCAVDVGTPKLRQTWLFFFSKLSL